jgi:hypothetical protein
LDFIETFSHLAEVCQAGDSMQMAKKNQQQRARIFREANRVAVGAEKRQVIHPIANLDCHG